MILMCLLFCFNWLSGFENIWIYYNCPIFLKMTQQSSTNRKGDKQKKSQADRARNKFVRTTWRPTIADLKQQILKLENLKNILPQS